MTILDKTKTAKDLSYHLSREGQLRRFQLMKQIFKFSPNENILLAHGSPRPDSFSIHQLKFKYSMFSHDKESDAVVEKQPTAQSALSLDRGMQYGTGKGFPPLLELVKEHIQSVHSLQYSNWDVVMTSGNTDALYQSATLLANWGDPVVVAKWCYPIALETFRGKGLKFLVADIDEEGLIPSSIEAVVNNYYQSNPNGPKCRLVYTVPTGQNPSGATMSLQRRKEFYAVCQSLDLIILEDDPYYFLQLPKYKPSSEYEESEFGIETLLPSLLSLDTDGRVIRMDSFSKVIAPGLRTAWITGPEWFTAKVEYLNDVSIQQPAGLSQIALTEILTNWNQDGFIEHLKGFRKEFTKRRDLFVSLTDQYLKGKVTYTPTVAGMFGWLKLNVQPEKVERGEPTLLHKIFDKLTAEKVVPIPGYFFDADAYQLNEEDCSDRVHPYFIRLCFSFVDPDQLVEGMRRIGIALDEILTR